LRLRLSKLEIKNKFWEKWKDISDIEVGAFETLNFGFKSIFEILPKNIIISIYVKGSFPLRQMDKDSDVDFVVVIKDSSYLEKIKEFDGKNRNICIPPLNLSAYSIDELKENKRFGGGKIRASPDLFVRYLERYELIYGLNLKKDDYKMRDIETLIKSRLKAFRAVFIPMYLDKTKKKLGFGDLIKQVFYLVELELELNGKTVPRTWKELDVLIKNKNHIIHDTYNLRVNYTKYKNKKETYLGKLEKYLSALDKKVN